MRSGWERESMPLPAPINCSLIWHYYNLSLTLLIALVSRYCSEQVNDVFLGEGRVRLLPRSVQDPYSQFRWQHGSNRITHVTEGRVKACAAGEGFQCLVSVSPPAPCCLFSFSLDTHAINAAAAVTVWY